MAQTTSSLAASREPQYDHHFVLPSGHASGLYKRGTAQGLPLIVGIHGGGCNYRFMDRPGYSYVEDAATLGRGGSILLVNRPGYGGTQDIGASNPIEAGTPYLVALIQTVWDQEAARIAAPGVFLIGHSIGGAVAYTLAAEPALPFPLLGLAVSGFAIHHPAALTALWAEGEGGPSRNAAAAAKLAELAFGPPGTYEPAAMQAAMAGLELPMQTELMEISHAWPGRFRTVAGKIRVPVWHGMAEDDSLWEVGPAAFAEMRPMYTSSPRVELVLMPEGGHAYDFHKRGRESHEQQFAFALSCVPGEGAKEQK